MFQHVLCVYPYRRDLKNYNFCPPLGLEYIGAVIEPHTRALDIVDLRKETGRTGPLFYSYVIAMNVALATGIAGLIMRAS